MFIYIFSAWIFNLFKLIHCAIWDFPDIHGFKLRQLLMNYTGSMRVQIKMVIHPGEWGLLNLIVLTWIKMHASIVNGSRCPLEGSKSCPECHLELFWSYLTHPGSLTELLFFLFELSFVYNWYSYGQQLLQNPGTQ